MDTSSKTRQVRRLIQARLGKDDAELAEAIVRIVLRPEEPPAGGPWWQHPAIQCARRVTGRQVPEIMRETIIEKLGDSPDEKRARACYLAMVERTGKDKPWWWLDDYAGRNGKPAQPERTLADMGLA